MKTVYIAHPLRGELTANVAKVTKICQRLSAENKIIPLSPIHAFGFLSPEGDQSLVMQYCCKLLALADELWVFGDWQKSEGCRAEVIYASENDIPIKFCNSEVGHEN